MEVWQTHIPKDGIDPGPGVAYSFQLLDGVLQALKLMSSSLWILLQFHHQCIGLNTAASMASSPMVATTTFNY